MISSQSYRNENNGQKNHWIFLKTCNRSGTEKRVKMGVLARQS